MRSRSARFLSGAFLAVSMALRGPATGTTIVPIPSRPAVRLKGSVQEEDSMRALRIGVFVVALVIVAGCGSSATPTPGASAAPSSAVASEAAAPSEAPAASESTGPAPSVGSLSGAGTVTVTVGTKTVTYTNAMCQDVGSGQVGIGAGDVNQDGVGLVIPPNGGDATLAGSIGGAIWAVTQSPQSTLNADRSGTFSGKDAMSGSDVSGTFVCK